MSHGNMAGPCLCGDPSCPSCFPSGPFEPEQDAIDAVESLLDVVVVAHHDRGADETLTECRLCGQWEDHAGNCPVPALLLWQGVK